MRAAAVLAAALLASACASPGAGRPDTTPLSERAVVAVEITNDARVTGDAYWGTILLGMVPAGATERFPVPQGVPRQPIRLVVAGEPLQSGRVLPLRRFRYIYAGAEEGR